MLTDVIEQFQAALKARGIIPEEILADGKIHRCDTEGRQRKGYGAYLLHLDGLPAGGFQNWGDGLGWEDWRADFGSTLSPDEERAHRAKVEAMRGEREAEDKKRKAEARERATAIWQGAKPAPDAHPYLIRKGIKAHGLRLHKDLLVVPMRDGAGELHSLQFIGAEGEKRFLTGGRVAACHYLIGKPDGLVCVVEGYATGASVHEATGYAVAVAFNVGNLEPVARTLKGKLPDARLILCADDDYQTEGNPGLTGALEAARAVGGLLAVPSFDSNRPEGATDFNDLHRAAGAEAVLACVTGAGFPPEEAKNESNTEGFQSHLEGPLQFNLTDLGNAERLVWFHGRDLRYCHAWNRWLVWDGRRWAVDATAEVRRRAKDTVRRMYEAASKIQNDERRKALTAWALKSESDMKIRAMLSLAESEAEIPVRAEDLDYDPWRLNCLSGTINLKTGELRPHRRQDLITKLCPVEYHPAADCPKWKAHLTRIMTGNEGMVSFLQRAYGYSATADTSERVLFIMWGSGMNGKSVTTETVAALLCDYGMRTPTQTLLAKRDAGIPNDLARLKGARFVYASETEEGKRLAEALIKDITGGDTISARFMRAEWFDFKPEFKLWLSTNHKPIIKGTDRAIWDRIRLVPFTVEIPVQDRLPKYKMLETFQAESAGILTWLVQGCLAWQRDGLKEPDQVKQATAEYRSEMDLIRDFIAECCVVERGATVKSKDLREAYVKWSKESGYDKPIHSRAFADRLVERGFTPHKGAGGTRYWTGLKLANGDTVSGASGAIGATSHINNTFCSHKAYTETHATDATNATNQETRPSGERCNGCTYFHLPASWKPEQAMCQLATRLVREIESCPRERVEGEVARD